jgi:hypothetical protein
VHVSSWPGGGVRRPDADFIFADQSSGSMVNMIADESASLSRLV